MDNRQKARDAILEDLKLRFKSGDRSVKIPENTDRFYKPQLNYFCGSGTIPCPVCNSGSLMYSRATYNGHVHARCTTKDCVAWME